MDIQEKPTASIIEYAHNNKIHTDIQIDLIANSIVEFGFNQPIVVDQDNVVLVGHGRLRAAKKLGRNTVPVLQLLGLNETQKRAYRILDNKIAYDSDWDFKNLRIEFEALQAADFQFNDWDFGVLMDEAFGATNLDTEDEKDNPYTQKINAPIYTPTTKEPPPVSELYQTEKCTNLVTRIESCEGLSSNERAFLCQAAQRHVVFDYQQIAEFYSHARKEVQELMEDSALVIIDFDKAIENGFVVLTEEVAKLYINTSPQLNNSGTSPTVE